MQCSGHVHTDRMLHTFTGHLLLAWFRPSVKQNRVLGLQESLEGRADQPGS